MSVKHNKDNGFRTTVLQNVQNIGS